MFDHISLTVTDLARSRAFYERALAPLGYAVRFEYGNSAGFGPEARPVFWIGLGAPPQVGTHVAFAVPDRATVDRFHAEAVAAGGRDHGAPGLRPHYHPNYYGAFVLDPDGHNVEAVCHAAGR